MLPPDTETFVIETCRRLEASQVDGAFGELGDAVAREGLGIIADGPNTEIALALTALYRHVWPLEDQRALESFADDIRTRTGLLGPADPSS